MANYTYTIGVSTDKFGLAQIGRSFSHTEPVTLSANDTITINFGSGTSGYTFFISPSLAFSGTTTGMSDSGDPYTLTYQGVYGTNGNNATLFISGTNGTSFPSGTAAIFKSNIDSSPSVSRQSVTTSSTSTAAETSFTVSGLATGKKCGFATTTFSNNSTSSQVKKGSGGTYATSVSDFSNGDTVFVKATSPDTKGVSSVAQFYSFDARGALVTDQVFELDVTVNEDTDSSYGMEFFDSSGDLLLSINDRSSRFVTKGSYTETIAANSVSTKTISLSGMDTSDKWIINAHVDLASISTTQFISIRSIVQETNQFKITTYNGDSSSRSITTEYYVLITG